MLGETTVVTLQLEIENHRYSLEKGCYLIGKDSRKGRSTNYIQLTNWHIDAKHCVLEVDSNEEIFIVDLESDSGIYVNNKRVDPLTKERLKLDEDFGLGEQLKAKIKLIEREESHNINHLESISVIKDVTPRLIAEDECVQQFKLENRISNDNDDSVTIPTTRIHQPISTSSAAPATNITNSINQNSLNEEVGDLHMPKIQKVKIEYPDFGDCNFVQSVPMTSTIRIDDGENNCVQLISKKTKKTKEGETLFPQVKSSLQQVERTQTSYGTISFQDCDQYSMQNNNKSKQVAKKGLGKKATNNENSIDQNSPNRDQEIGNFHTSKIQEVKNEYPDCGDYNFVQSVPMTSTVRIGREENSLQSISKTTEKTKYVEMLFPRVRSASQHDERAQTSQAMSSFQGFDQYSTQNNNKIKEISKKGLGNKKVVLERKKESNKNTSNEEVERSQALDSTVAKTSKNSNIATRNIGIQGATSKRATRLHTLEYEPSCFNNLPENNEVDKTLTIRVTRSHTRKKESNNNTEQEMPGRRLTRSCTQDGERTKKKERKTSLTLVHSMETRTRLKSTNRSSCSNANNAESSGNEVKRKGGANFSSKKSKYAKRNDC